jgi:hypothetical protein
MAAKEQDQRHGERQKAQSADIASRETALAADISAREQAMDMEGHRIQAVFASDKRGQ